MPGITLKSLVLLPQVFLCCLPGSAQTAQVLPEIDTNVKLSSDLRFSYQAKATREGGDPEQAEIGPSLDFYLKPLVRLQDATKFDLDDANPRPLVFSIGYRYMPEANKAPPINRMEPVLTFHLPIGDFCYPTKIVQILTGRTVVFRGAIVTVFRSKRRSRSAPITLHHTPAPSSSTKANTVNGV